MPFVGPSLGKLVVKDVWEVVIVLVKRKKRLTRDET